MYKNTGYIYCSYNKNLPQAVQHELAPISSDAQQQEFFAVK